MENKRGKLFNGLSLNTLKIIGFITMFIDHIAVYFNYKLTPEVYLICRIIGRIAMPLFVYILVQGYIHTSSLKKYALRLGFLAVITQLVIYILSHINYTYYPNYINNLSGFFNILFSFVLSLILLRSLDFSKKYFNKFNKYINAILRIISIICVVSIYYYVNIDYSFVVPIMSINFLLFEKLKSKVSKESLKIACASIELILMLIISVIYNVLEIFVVIDIFLIFLYNGRKKNRIELNRFATYSFFPIHNAILYFFAMVIGG